MARNKLYIEHYVKAGTYGCRLAKQTIIERIRQMFYGKRYIKLTVMRKTDYAQACYTVATFSQVITAEWFDRFGRSAVIVKDKRANKLPVYVSRVLKHIVKV